MGLPGLMPSSNGASTMSLTAPIANWRQVIDSPEHEGDEGPSPGDERDQGDDGAVEQRRERVDEPGGGDQREPGRSVGGPGASTAGAAGAGSGGGIPRARRRQT